MSLDCLLSHKFVLSEPDKSVGPNGEGDIVQVH
jgi:hypothetical protein